MSGTRGPEDDAAPASGPVAFAEFELDPDRVELRRAGSPIPIGAVALRVLWTLVSNAGAFVSKEALTEAVWPETAVSDASVYTALREVRRALGDDGARQRLIETRRGRGYRLVVAVRPQGGAPLSALEIAERWYTRQGSEAPEALVRRIQGRTWGDADLVDALIDRLCDEGAVGLEAAFRAELVALPTRLLEQAVGRMTPLPAETAGVLQRFAVFGTEFERERAGSFGAHTMQEIAAALDRASELGWIEKDPARPRRMRFRSPVAAEYLHARMPSSERELLHAAAATLLEDRVDELDGIEEVAAQWLRSGAKAERAIPWCRRAAEGLARAGRGDEAVVRRYAALSVADALEWSERHRLWIELGDALFAVGHNDAARGAHWRAIELAREHQDSLRFGEAVLGYTGSSTNMETGVHSSRRVALLEEALSRLTFPTSSSLIAVLQARLALELSWGRRPVEVRTLVEAALARVRGGAVEPDLVAGALHDVYWATWSPENTEERIAIGAEMHRAAEAARQPVLSAMGAALHGAAVLESGNRAEAESAYAAGREPLAREHHTVEFLRIGRLACIALLEGRFEEAEELATRAHVSSRKLGARNSDTIYAAQIGWIRFDQGRLHELEAVSRVALGAPRPEQRAGRALILAHAGRDTEARIELEDLVARLGDLPRDPFWLATHATLVECASKQAAPDAAAVLYDALLPHAHRSVLFGIRTVCRGSVELYLGLAARTCGRLDAAAVHFDRAAEVNARLRAAPLLARSLIALADCLERMGDERDADRARDARAEGQRIRLQLGLAPDLDLD